MNLNRFLSLFAALLAGTASAVAQNESLASIFTSATVRSGVHRNVPHRPSIIFITCHGLALGDLSCYGQTNFQTPNLDFLATEGTRFTDYSAISDELSLSQAALMTGNDAPFSAGETTVAARLHANGYRTGLIGEWALGSQPWTQGFDEFAGFFNEQEADNYYSDFVRRYTPHGDFDQTNHTFRPFIGPEEIYANTGGKKGVYIPDLLLMAAGNFVKNNQPDFANHYRPFFLLVNLPLPHSVTPGKDDYPVPTDAPFTGENWPQAAKNRAALMTRLDEKVGRLLQQLDRLGMTNNVAVFLAGAVAPEKFADTNMDFLRLKGEVRGGSSEARLRVPMIFCWPGLIPERSVSDLHWTAADFAPTAMGIAGVKSTAAFKGVSVLPALLGHSRTNTPASSDRAQRP